ncbi:MAG TPA: hypothetical protein PLQ93_04420 [Bacteroidia bacterium]|nr:hypothetical protein [Bacteroidia bacterium]
MIRSFLIVPAILFLFSCQSGEGDKKSLAAQIETINRQCPKMVDSETQLLRVQFIEPSTLLYEYCLPSLNRMDVDTQRFRENLWPGLVAAIRTDPGMESLRKKDMRFEYRYLDRSKQLIYTFKIQAQHYLKP